MNSNSCSCEENVNVSKGNSVESAFFIRLCCVCKKYGIKADVQNAESYMDLSKSIVESFTSCGEIKSQSRKALERINTLYKEMINLEPNLEKTEFLQNIIVKALVGIDDNFVIKDNCLSGKQVYHGC